MTVVTELTSRFGGFKGFLRRGGLVAGIALHGSDGIVSAHLQKFCLQRGMRIVTARASGFVHRITAVGLFKRNLAAVMAAEAKRGLGLNEEVFLV